MSNEEEIRSFTALNEVVMQLQVKIRQKQERIELLESLLFSFGNAEKEDKDKLEKMIENMDGEDERFEMIGHAIQLACFCAFRRQMQHDADAHSLRKEGRHGDATYDEICNFRLSDIQKALSRVKDDLEEIKDEAQYFLDRIPNEGDES